MHQYVFQGTLSLLSFDFKISFFTLNTIFAIHTCFTPKLVTLADLGRGKAQPYSEII